MSYNRAYVLIVAMAIALPGMAAPKPARATVPSTQNTSETSMAGAGDALPTVSGTEVQASADSAWTGTRLDDAKGFTEAAIAYEPEPVAQDGADKQVQQPANKPSDGSSRRTKVPEPGTLVLFGTVLIGIAHAARKRMKR